MMIEKMDKPTSGPNVPHNLEANAREFFRNAEKFREKHQQRSMRECYEEALDLGRRSETPDGLVIASEACLYLGHYSKTRSAWGLAIERYTESMDLGKRSKTPEGLYAAARAAWNLGNTLEEAGMDGLMEAFRKAIDFGRESNTSDALEVAAKAAFNLAVNKYPETNVASPDIVDDIIGVWREAIELGKASGTRDGAEVASKAEKYISELQEVLKNL
jgi:tetratricopeptide (TPR) repeat protein